ncbi:MAG: tRNA pseudouridine(38-40) synthase TruA [Parachlamydiaceae bacterium]|nr:tRNA pseudouridine(38-40) synthase TruA [Parachlamydiaceae bacterium]
MRNIRLKIAYDGANYLGWQKTDAGPSIESTFENIFFKILQEYVYIQAASRTDAGVHARGQVINIRLPKARPSLIQLRMSLACLLPNDLAVLELSEAAENFHPTLDCISKEYHYSVCHGISQMPQLRFYSWHYAYPLDICKMKEAAKHLVGEHDFSTFCNFKSSAQYDNFIRNVKSIDIIDVGEQQIRFKVIGNNFLYKMVRNLVGTLVYVGCGKIPLESIPDILAKKDRTRAGVTAPAHGLCLYQVNYK